MVEETKSAQPRIIPEERRAYTKKVVFKSISWNYEENSISTPVNEEEEGETHL